MKTCKYCKRYKQCKEYFKDIDEGLEWTDLADCCTDFSEIFDDYWEEMYEIYEY